MFIVFKPDGKFMTEWDGHISAKHHHEDDMLFNTDNHAWYVVYKSFDNPRWIVAPIGVIPKHIQLSALLLC